MAHGQKRWITTYDGRIKRSNKRTLNDYFGDLKWWEPARQLVGWRRANPKKAKFCPQCKHFFKEVKAHNERYDVTVAALKKEWLATPEMVAAVAKYKRVREQELRAERRFRAEERRLNPNVVFGLPRWISHERDPRDRFWEYQALNAERLPPRPIHHEETFLCPKHRRKFDVKNEMWGRGRPQLESPRSKKDWRPRFRNFRGNLNNQFRCALATQETEDFDPFEEMMTPPKRFKAWYH